MSDTSDTLGLADQMRVAGCLLLIGVGFVVMLFLTWVPLSFVVGLFPAGRDSWPTHYAPSLEKPAESEREKAVRLLVASCENAFGVGGAGTGCKIERRAGDNVRVFLTRETFESVPYPDRPKVIADIAKEWCRGSRKIFLPTVYFIDIRTGDGLGKQNCTLPEIL
jgi:hypothetical protein